MSESKENELKTYSYEKDGIIFNYYIGYEILSLLGYKNTSEVIRNNISEFNKIEFRNFPGDKIDHLDPRVILINKEGVNEIISKTKKQIPVNTLSILKKYKLLDDDKDELTTYSYISNGLIFEYFVGYEIATLLGYKYPKDILTNNVSKSNQILFRDYPGVQIPELDPKTILITNDGAVEILLKTRKLITPDTLHILKKFNIDTTNRKCLTKEQQNLNAITNTFKTEKFEDQFKVGKYYLDLYFPEYKIVIEVDEHGHRDRRPSDERERMDFVNEELSIDDSYWIRFNPDEYNFDITKVIGQIMRKMKEKEIKTEINIKKVDLISEIMKVFESEKMFRNYELKEQNINLFFQEYRIIVVNDDENNSSFIKKDKMIKINDFLNIDDTYWIFYNKNSNISDVTGEIYRKINYIKETRKKRNQICVSDIAKIFASENPVVDYEVSNKYKIDLYFPVQKVIFDFEKYDETRINFINTFLEIDQTYWIIFNEDNETFDIAKAIGKLYMLMKEKEIFFKLCTKCRKEKPSSDFYKDKKRPDGLGLRCKDCRLTITVNSNEPKAKIETPESKICPECNENKLSSLYWKNKDRSDGIDSICKACRKKRDQKIIDTPKITPEMKKCSSCKETKKTITNFNKRKKSVDGYCGTCKSCSYKRPGVLNSKERKKEERKLKRESSKETISEKS